MPKVSVIVPVYNAGEKLVPSIASLLGQTLKDLEIIIVNDASTDHTEEVIDRLARENSNIVPLHFGENKGAHEARLAGLKKSTAPWIGFLDADDFARTTMFESMHNHAAAQDVDIVVCGSYRVTNERELIAPKLRFRRNKRVESGAFEQFCRFEFGTGMLWNKLYRREVIIPYSGMHFPWRQSINEDLLLNIGCFYRAQSVYLCKEVLHEYVLNESSVTSTANNVKAYVDTYRAAALAVSVFSELGSDVLTKIIDMYRTQLSWGDYQIKDVGTILAYEDELKEAADLIYSIHAPTLALLAARQRPPLIGAKVAIKSLLHRSLAAAGLNSRFAKR